MREPKLSWGVALATASDGAAAKQGGQALYPLHMDETP